MKKDEIIQLIESSAITVAASFPVLSSIATGWKEYKDYMQWKNVEFLLNSFYSQLKIIEDELDTGYVKSEEFKSLLIKTCFIAESESSEDKKKYLSFYLANTCKEEHSKEKIHNIILETLNKINAVDIQILKYINSVTGENWDRQEEEYYPAGYAWTSTYEKDILDNFSDHEELDILGILEYLNSIGVIENFASRGIDFFQEKNYRESLYLHKSNELLNKQISLQQDGSFEAIKESQKIQEELEEIETYEKESLQPEFEKNQYQKFYSISALGRKLLIYLEA